MSTLGFHHRCLGGSEALATDIRASLFEQFATNTAEKVEKTDVAEVQRAARKNPLRRR
jgi:hypothetical protein